MYTRRAGFLDLAHLRESADWTRYARDHARALIDSGGGTHRFSREGTAFEMVITLPPWWRGLAPSQRADLAREASLHFGQRAACQVETWHEIATWYGWSTFPLISETGSAFTWDDSTSHLVGVNVAARVLRHGGDEDYDERTAYTIRCVLEELEAVPRADVDRAAEAVKGRWWKDGLAVRRDLDTGLETGRKAAWVVPGMGYAADAEPEPLSVPTLTQIAGRDLSGVYDLRIVSSSIARRVFAPAEPPATISAECDFPAIIERIRAEVRAKWGPDADRP